MFDTLPREKERTSWCLVAAWALIIYLTIPFARWMQKAVTEVAGRIFFRDLVIMLVVLGVGLLLIYSVRNLRRFSWGRAGWLLAVAGAYIYYTTRLRASPEEALHFIEYGVLGLLLYRALIHRIHDPSIYLVAVLAGAIIGTVDEIIQWITPRRYWDFRDVWLNVFSVILMQVAVAGGMRPRLVAGAIPARSMRRAGVWATVFLVLMGLCIFNTPARTDWYADRIPGLAFLKNNPSVMAEYGYRIEDPDIGVFYSRFSSEELKQMDVDKGAQAREIINAYHNPETYAAFLNLYSSGVAPFIHEARVHLFRRDHYISVLSKYTDDPEKEAWHATVAWREHAIIERYFSNTLAGSLYVLPRGRLDYLRVRQDPEKHYESPVSRHLITRWSQAELLGGAVVLIALIQLGMLYSRRMEKRTKDGTGMDEYSEA